MDKKQLLAKMLTVASLTTGVSAFANTSNYYTEQGAIECSKTLVKEGWFYDSKHSYFTKIDLDNNTITFKHVKNDEVQFTTTFEVKLYRDDSGNAVIYAKVPHSSLGDIKETEIGYYNYEANRIDWLDFVYGGVEGGNYIRARDLSCD